MLRVNIAATFAIEPVTGTSESIILKNGNRKIREGELFFNFFFSFLAAKSEICPMIPVGNRQSKMIKMEAGPTQPGQLPAAIKRLLQVFLHYPEHQRQSP